MALSLETWLLKVTQPGRSRFDGVSEYHSKPDPLTPLWLPRTPVSRCFRNLLSEVQTLYVTLNGLYPFRSLLLCSG